MRARDVQFVGTGCKEGAAAAIVGEGFPLFRLFLELCDILIKFFIVIFCDLLEAGWLA